MEAVAHKPRIDIALKLSVAYSLVSSRAIENELVPLYDLPHASSVFFFHQGINDTYLITTGEAKFILRIYRTTWKTIDEVSAELNLILLLKEHGLPVSYPLHDKSGKFIQEIDCPEGIRLAVIFSHAPGEGLSGLNSQSAHLFGQYVGRLHNITENLKLDGLLTRYTVAEILTSSKRSLQLPINSAGDAYQKVENIFHRLQEKLSIENLEDVRSGICHGDLHHENICMEASSGKITLFDFDFCGHGYLIYDLGAFCRYERDNQDNKVNFLEGYKQVRPLNQKEKNALPYFEVLMRVFHLGARAINADGIRNPKWSKSDIEKTIFDIDVQLTKIINETSR